MKLCKDCKHFGFISVGMGHCKHPSAEFNVVDGSPGTYCFQARGEIMISEKTICGKEGRLFEQAPTPVEIDIRKGFFERLFGWL